MLSLWELNFICLIPTKNPTAEGLSDPLKNEWPDFVHDYIRDYFHREKVPGTSRTKPHSNLYTCFLIRDYCSGREEGQSRMGWTNRLWMSPGLLRAAAARSLIKRGLLARWLSLTGGWFVVASKLVDPLLETLPEPLLEELNSEAERTLPDPLSVTPWRKN